MGTDVGFGLWNFCILVMAGCHVTTTMLFESYRSIVRCSAGQYLPPFSSAVLHPNLDDQNNEKSDPGLPCSIPELNNVSNIVKCQIFNNALCFFFVFAFYFLWRICKNSYCCLDQVFLMLFGSSVFFMLFMTSNISYNPSKLTIYLRNIPTVITETLKM